MLVTEGLGFKSLVLIVVCLAFPVIVFLIRRKWRRSVARKEEIERLLILAKEEADRAELEATASYSGLVSYSGPVSVSQTSYTCAVCYCPTTTRCARCKAVRYCSGRCQIIHWRQGHKEECRPPSISNHQDHDGSSRQSVVQGDSNNDRYKKEPCMKDDENTVCSVADSEETSSVSGSSGNSFSGFSTSAAAGESSDDVSVSESTSSSELEGSDDQMPLDIGRGTLDPNLDKVNQTNPVSPKFASLVESVHNFDRSIKFKETTQSSQVLENQGASSNSQARTRSVSEISSISAARQVSSGLLGEPLVAVVRDHKAPADSSLSKITNARNNSLSDAEPVQRVLFNHSREDVQSAEKKGVKIDTTDPDATGISNPFGRAASSEKSCADTQTIGSSMSSNIEKSNHTDADMTSNSNVSKPGELKAASLSDIPYPSLRTGREILGPSVKVSGSSSTSFARSNLPDVSVSTSQPSDSRLSHSESPRRHSVSKINENSVPDVKEKINTVKSSTQMESLTMASSVSGLKSSMKKVVDQFRGHKYGRYSDKGLFPYDSFVKLYTTTKVDMQPCGLINCGNSCYANAVLQCLLFTPPLTAYFVQGLHSKTCANKERCFSCEFEKLIVKAKEGKSPLSPIGIITQLKNIGCQLGHGREEDAHEFLRYAVDAMQSICFKEYGVTKPGFLEEETTLIGLTFGGYLRSKIRCSKCQNKSERQERMMDITVEIEGDVEKLEDALKRFTSTEILDGENKYLCDRCKSYQKAKKKLTIHEAPNVLTIALKRFQSGKFGKLNKPIRFPEILDLAPYMSGTSDTSPIYRLYGVVVHLDVMNAAFSGHYVCYVKNLQNKWFKINDSEVSSVEVKKVLSEGAYMLLYARCSPRAPRYVRNHISSDPKLESSSRSKINSKDSSLATSTSTIRENHSQPDDLSRVESFYLKFHRLQRILEEDSSSDNYSFTSSNSDEGSCSTESTVDSTSTEDFADYIFGGQNSSPLYSRYS